MHSRKALRPDVVKSLYEKAIQEDTWYWAYTPDGLMTKDTWRSRCGKSKEWLKFGFYSKEEQKLRGIQSWIEAMGELEVTNSHPTNLELNPKGVSKASGLSEVCALLGIQMSEVVAVGDSMNDYAMIQAAGLGVAMGNAQEELKRIANRVTASNVEHGVAEVFALRTGVQQRIVRSYLFYDLTIKRYWRHSSRMALLTYLPKEH